jgi:hypothetical protein
MTKNISLFTLALILFYASLETGFFWDNSIFGYQMGMHLFENGLFNLNIPDSIDPGHPPFLAFILALSWKTLGKSLITSHLVLFPFVYGLLYQLFEFVKTYTDKNYLVIFPFILVILDPTLDTQLLLIGPEVIQLFFFFLAINSILKEKIVLKTIGLFFLGIVSFRGMMLFFGIFLFDIIRHFWLHRKSIQTFITRNNTISYSIAIIPAFLYITWRLTIKGWLQTHPDSPFAHLWHYVNIQEFFRNLIFMMHRYADFGRVTYFIFISWMLYTSKKLFINDPKNKELILLAFVSVIAIILVSLFSINTFGHRYFIVSYLAFALLAFRLITKLNKSKKIVYIVLVASLIGGNFWIYPERISQGWDASLAHLPFYNLRETAIKYLYSNNIKIESVATFAPNQGRIETISLSGNLDEFADFTGNDPYVFYSNIFNLNDQTYEILEQKYTCIKAFEKKNIYIQILKRKN